MGTMQSLDPADGPAPGPLTEEDYWGFPDDGKHRQLLDGWEVVMPPSRRRHQDAIQILVHRLMGHLDINPVGFVQSGPYPVRLSSRTVVEPDVFYIARDREAMMEETVCRGAPDWIAEVLSPSNRPVDEVRKLRLYSRYGVGEYWIVDPEIRAVKVFRREGKSLALVRQAMADGGDVLELAALPGLEIPVAALFPG